MPLVPTLCFLALIGLMLFIDLAVLNRGSHTISASKALKQASIWVAVAVAFSAVIYTLYEHHHFGFGLADGAVAAAAESVGGGGGGGIADGGLPGVREPLIGAGPEAGVSPKRDPFLPHDGREAAVMFATGYLLELMLSLDNMMVIGIIMTYFKVPSKYQHRALFWGIIGAVTLRGAMISAGAVLVHQFHWILYVFGAFLLLTAVKLFFEKEDEAPDLEKNLGVRMARALFPVSPDYVGSNFFTRINGKLAITPLMLALITIEFADVIFAVDSIPAAFSAIKDPFLVLTSNCFAILGLRAIYFAVAAITAKFRFLKQSMILILALIGIKMLLPLGEHVALLRDSGMPLHVSPLASLLGIAGLMAGGVVLSMAIPAPGKDAPTDEPHG